jgi:hypothetical protein
MTSIIKDAIDTMRTAGDVAAGVGQTLQGFSQFNPSVPSSVMSEAESNRTHLTEMTKLPLNATPDSLQVGLDAMKSMYDTSLKHCTLLSAGAGVDGSGKTNQALVDQVAETSPAVAQASQEVQDGAQRAVTATSSTGKSAASLVAKNKVGNLAQLQETLMAISAAFAECTPKRKICSTQPNDPAADYVPVEGSGLDRYEVRLSIAADDASYETVAGWDSADGVLAMTGAAEARTESPIIDDDGVPAGLTEAGTSFRVHLFKNGVAEAWADMPTKYLPDISANLFAHFKGGDVLVTAFNATEGVGQSIRVQGSNDWAVCSRKIPIPVGTTALAIRPIAYAAGAGNVEGDFQITGTTIRLNPAPGHVTTPGDLLRYYQGQFTSLNSDSARFNDVVTTYHVSQGEPWDIDNLWAQSAETLDPALAALIRLDEVTGNVMDPLIFADFGVHLAELMPSRYWLNSASAYGALSTYQRDRLFTRLRHMVLELQKGLIRSPTLAADVASALGQ